MIAMGSLEAGDRVTIVVDGAHVYGTVLEYPAVDVGPDPESARVEFDCGGSQRCALFELHRAPARTDRGFTRVGQSYWVWADTETLARGFVLVAGEANDIRVDPAIGAKLTGGAAFTTPEYAWTWLEALPAGTGGAARRDAGVVTLVYATAYSSTGMRLASAAAVS